ncbi:MAG TPA: hypothetical protein VGJ91_23970 [Polyangiaceae bacterium]|jgi:hypothetical protein
MSRALCGLLLGLALLGVSACSDDGGSGTNAGGALSACLERPDQLPRAPTGALPCELLPPGLSLK